MAEYRYPVNIVLTISMVSCANAKVQIWMGEEFTNPAIPSIEIVVPGNWVQDLQVPLSFNYPGTHVIYINVSNSINFVETDSQVIDIKTPVDSLNAALFQSPVIYMLSGFGEAFFKFYFDNMATSGIFSAYPYHNQHMVVFWL